MESIQKVIEWISQNHSKYNIRIEQDNWVSEYIQGPYHYTTYIEHDGISTYGISFDFNEDLAILKSFSEAIERYFTRRLKLKNTNGCSVHLTQDRAKLNAEHEILERDAFLTNFYTQYSCSRLKSKFFDLKLKSLEKQIVNLGGSTSFHELKSADNCTITVCFLRPSKEHGVIIGAKYGRNKQLPALLEVLLDFIYFLKGNNKTVSFNEFINLEDPNFRDHLALSLNKEYFSSFLSRVDFSSTQCIQVPFKFQHNIYDLSESIFEGLPMFFCHAESNELQTLYSGVPTPKKMNLNRLNVNFEDIAKIVHIFS